MCVSLCVCVCSDRVAHRVCMLQVCRAQSGETVQVSAELVADTKDGSARATSFFRLADRDGNMFGPRLWADLLLVEV